MVCLVTHKPLRRVCKSDYKNAKVRYLFYMIVFLDKLCILESKALINKKEYRPKTFTMF